MRQTVRVAAIQLRPDPTSARSTIFDALKLGKRAAEGEAEVICFPEHWLPEKKIPPELNPIPGLQSLAEEYGTVVIGGAFYERVNRVLRLSCPIIDSDGELLGRQFKVHLFRSEKKIASPGREHLVYHVSGGRRLGVMVCYDVDFPESARSLALQGADLLFCPSRIVKYGTVPWHEYVTVRALENRIPIVAPNVYSPPWFLGGSVIVDLKEDPRTKISYPRATGVRRKHGEGIGIVVQDLDLDYHRKLRLERFRDRQPKAYNL